MPVNAAEFIIANTKLCSAPLVPELSLWLADELTPLWQATETWLAQQNCAPPYWAFAWPGSQALARYILDNPALVQGKRVLDLAAGCGIATIAAQVAGAAAATANEIDLVAIAAQRLNATANDIELIYSEGDLTNSPFPVADLIIAGDICYEQNMTKRLFQWLRCITAAGKEIWLADPGRTYLPTQGLTAFATYDVSVSQDLESANCRCTTLYRIDS